MAGYVLHVRYDNDEAFQEHDANIQTTVNNKFTEKGTTKIEKLHSALSFPPNYVFAIDVPDGVSQEDLEAVDLGDGVSKDFMEA